MTRFVVIFGGLLTLVCGGSALMQDGDVAAAAAKGDWDGVQQLLKKYVESRLAVPPLTQPLQPASAAELLKQLPVAAGSPGPGGRYFAQSEYSYEQKTNNNGKVNEDKGGLGVINDNGKVTYYTPRPGTNPYIPSLGFNNQNMYGVSPYGG